MAEGVVPVDRFERELTIDDQTVTYRRGVSIESHDNYVITSHYTYVLTKELRFGALRLPASHVWQTCRMLDMSLTLILDCVAPPS